MGGIAHDVLLASVPFCLVPKGSSFLLKAGMPSPKISRFQMATAWVTSYKVKPGISGLVSAGVVYLTTPAPYWHARIL